MWPILTYLEVRMLRTLISFTPFMVCLFWFIVFSLRYHSHNPAKKVLTWFLLTCTVLYLCHALFFTTGPHRATECIWALCSLSVYPIYHLYIRALTTNFPNSHRRYLTLLPGFMVFVLLVVCPGSISNLIRIIVFTGQIAFVCYFGFRMLKRFDKLVASCYANVEGKDTKDVKNLLIALIITSVISLTANVIGKSFFASDDRLLLVAAILFGVMLFALSYLGYTKDFSYVELTSDTAEEGISDTSPESFEAIGIKLDKLMKEKRLYLEKDLKINDVASRIGSCRTYVSNYINQSRGLSFSDYVNHLRIEDAKAILSSDIEIKNLSLAEQLGFANEQSFYRNFKKITGMTPAQWRKLDFRKQHPVSPLSG